MLLKVFRGEFFLREIAMPYNHSNQAFQWFLTQSLIISIYFAYKKIKRMIKMTWIISASLFPAA
jgi:hypothetical protein